MSAHGGQRLLLPAVLLLSLLAGCASSGRAPPPAAAEPLLPVAAAVVGAQVDGAQEHGAHEDGTRVLPPAAAPPLLEVYDPWERMNRSIYRFNARFDEAVFLPVASGYRRLVPRVLRTGIGNFFSNLGEVDNIVNFALQGRLRHSGRSLARMLLNSTLGIGGVLDVASSAGLVRAPTSFGTTLSRWGVGPGPYLVVPLLGPSTTRDGVGMLLDFGMTRAIDAGGLYSSDGSLLLGTTEAVDGRARIDFRYYATGSPFEYENLRFLYTRKRMIESEIPRRERPAEEAQVR